MKNPHQFSFESQRDRRQIDAGIAVSQRTKGPRTRPRAKIRGSKYLLAASDAVVVVPVVVQPTEVEDPLVAVPAEVRHAEITVRVAKQCAWKDDVFAPELLRVDRVEVGENTRCIREAQVTLEYHGASAHSRSIHGRLAPVEKGGKLHLLDRIVGRRHVLDDVPSARNERDGLYAGLFKAGPGDDDLGDFLCQSLVIEKGSDIIVRTALGPHCVQNPLQDLERGTKSTQEFAPGLTHANLSFITISGSHTCLNTVSRLAVYQNQAFLLTAKYSTKMGFCQRYYNQISPYIPKIVTIYGSMFTKTGIILVINPSQI